MCIYDFAFCCKFGKMSHIHVFRGGAAQIFTILYRGSNRNLLQNSIGGGGGSLGTQNLYYVIYMDGHIVKMSVYFFNTCTLHRISDMQAHKSTWDLDEPYFHGLFVLSQIHLNKSLRFLCFLRNCVLLQAQLSSRDGGPFSHEINLQDCQNNLFQILKWGFV